MSDNAGMPTYSRLAKWLHWLTVAMVLPLFAVGLVMHERAERGTFDATTNQMYSMHKLFGFMLLWLVVARLVNRLLTKAPPPVPTLTPFERLASGATHHFLYLLLLVVPLLGWAGISAFPALTIFDSFSLPAILRPDEELAKRLFRLHGLAAKLMMLLVLAHFGAALLHGVIKRDGVMNRMIGWWPLRR